VVATGLKRYIRRSALRIPSSRFQGHYLRVGAACGHVPAGGNDPAVTGKNAAHTRIGTRGIHPPGRQRKSQGHALVVKTGKAHSCCRPFWSPGLSSREIWRVSLSPG
jgi:hypothetical protein